MSQPSLDTPSNDQKERRSFFSKYSPIVCQLPTWRESRRHAMCKWRHSWDASDQFSMQVGMDFTTLRGCIKPWIGARLLQDPEKPDDGWAVEVNTDMAVVQCPTVDLVKPFRRLWTRSSESEEVKMKNSKKAFEIPVNARIGTDFFQDTAAPHIEIGVKNTAVICGMLVCSLALQKPMSIHVKRKEVGLGSYDLTCCAGTVLSPAMEIDGQLKRRGWQIMVQLDDLVPVIRTSSSPKKQECRNISSSPSSSSATSGSSSCCCSQ